jgi:hypothetical protein
LGDSGWSPQPLIHAYTGQNPIDPLSPSYKFEEEEEVMLEEE